MTTQYKFGIENLRDDEIVQLAPARVDTRTLRKMPHAGLLRLRNIMQINQGYYQDLRDARHFSTRLARIDDEIERRGLQVWLDVACESCGEQNSACLFDYQKGASLGSACACVRGMNFCFNFTVHK